MFNLEGGAQLFSGDFGMKKVGSLELIFVTNVRSSINLGNMNFEKCLRIKTKLKAKLELLELWITEAQNGALHP